MLDGRSIQKSRPRRKTTIQIILPGCESKGWSLATRNARHLSM